MNKFEGIIKKISGYDSHEVKDKDKELHDKFMEYVSKKADKENPEELKFSDN